MSELSTFVLILVSELQVMLRVHSQAFSEIMKVGTLISNMLY